MLQPLTLNDSKGIQKIGWMEKYVKNVKAFKKTRLHSDKKLCKKA